MKIDKARFVFLTAGLAAASGIAVASSVSGCSSSSKEAPNVSSPTTPDGSTADGATTTGDTDAGDTDAGDQAPCLARGVDAGPDAGDPLSDCGGLSGYCGPACESAALDLDFGAANAVYDCMKAKQNAGVCDSSNTANVLLASCLETVLTKACKDTSVVKLCTDAVSSCGAPDGGTADAGAGSTRPFNQANCEKYASALTDEARVKFGSCVAEGASNQECAACFNTWELIGP